MRGKKKTTKKQNKERYNINRDDVQYDQMSIVPTNR